MPLPFVSCFFLFYLFPAISVGKLQRELAVHHVSTRARVPQRVLVRRRFDGGVSRSNNTSRVCVLTSAEFAPVKEGRGQTFEVLV